MLTKLIATCLSKNLDFSVYRMPGAKIFNVFIENPEEEKHPSTHFVMHPFVVDSDSSKLVIHADFHATNTREFEQALASIKSWKTNPSGSPYPNGKVGSKEDYFRTLKAGMDKIEQGEMQKFVLSRIHRVAWPEGFTVAGTYLKMAAKYNNTFAYLAHAQQAGLWMGTTPETLVRTTKDSLYTMALAGTKKASDKIVWSQKEKDEQAYVSHYIEKVFEQNEMAFKRLKTDTIVSGPVAHLRTRFQVDNLQKSALKIVDSLHPTPAVCGVPFETARQFILKNEPHNRSYYTGYLGPQFDEGIFRFFVNLRCMKIGTNHLDLYVGGGITASSNPESEWQETCLKAETLLSVLNQK